MYHQLVCQAFSAAKFPLMLLLRDKKVYSYKGPICAKSIMQDFFKDSLYENKMVAENLEQFVMNNEEHTKQ